MFRFKSAERFRALFTSANPKPLLRQIPAFMFSSWAGAGNENGNGGVDRKAMSPELSKQLFNTNAPSRSMHVCGGGVDREVLPPELSRSVARLTCAASDIYLIGTDHYSQESDEEVKAVINILKPEITWYRAFRGGSLVKSAPLFICPNKAWNSMNSEKSISYDHPNLLAIDKYLLSNLKEIFLNERDQYMLATLLKVACEHNSVVAVVEKCHLQGISKYWKRPIEVMELLSTPWFYLKFGEFFFICFSCLAFLLIIISFFV